MNTAQPVSSAIIGVEFGFLNSQDVKALSVKRITNPTTFDSLLHPVPNGLHDSALGSFMDNPCSTCNLTTFQGCPGHPGHIELPVPVYHVSFMEQLLRLLRGKCVYCHGFKMPRVQVNSFVCKLRLIRCGLIQEAEDMDDQIDLSGGKNQAGAEEDSGSESNAQDSIIAQRNAYVKKAMKAAGISRSDAHKPQEKTEAAMEGRRLVIRDFYQEMARSRKCRNCGGINPSYRKDRTIKIFRKNLSSKDRALMVQAEKRAENPLTILARRDRKPGAKVHADEGVADLDMGSADESEDVDMIDAEEAGDSLVVGEASMGADKRPTAGTDTDLQEFMTPAEVRAHMVLLFEQEEEVLRLVYSPHSRSKSRDTVSPDMFFFHNIFVTPNKYRMEEKSGDSVNESGVNSLYKTILEACDTLRQIQDEINGQENEFGYRRRSFADLQTAWVNLQGAVNGLVDSEANPTAPRGALNQSGVKQILEKKDGMFRKNMMGKRVNFAARSVIAPDPFIESGEIGVPPVFAKKLTYPEPVTTHNFYDLKEAVLNGPDKWPGAVAIENEFGQVINLKKKNFEERQALANQLLAPSSTSVSGAVGKRVHRHLNNGDLVIMNRQPTLHKPSMMVHRARVLPGEKTIRMHYANTNTYNADFDGDEMNMHFPQNEIARAEAATIADTDHQYLSATAGKPLRGLIQDHITMGVWLSSRDMFFSREEYQELIYSGLRPEDGHTTSGTLITVPPAIIKPRPLWTGKQVITTVLANITPVEYPGLSFVSKSSTNGDLWAEGSEEGTVLFQDNYFLTGVIDKSQIGAAAGGLTNAVYEAYGPTTAGRLLSIIGRVLTRLLVTRAHSCGVEDLFLSQQGEEARLRQLQATERAGFEVAAKYVSLDASKIDPDNLELQKRLEQVLRDDTKQHALDLLTNTASGHISSAVTKACLPKHLIKLFPKNQMQLMTLSGAKGSLVNANLISCNLGQQVLEGRRVPVMVSGKTLPCFKPYETSIRAGGYVVNRFLTGIRPQETFFHTMAGREGLIDTAVKTSRSGYLQRVIVKGLEGLRVSYDTSVRDSDGSMIQFLYGEDGLDTTKVKYLNDFKFQAMNFYSLFNSLNAAETYAHVASEEATEYTKSAYKKVRKTGDLNAADPALAVYTPSRFSGSTSEKFYASKKEYCEKNPDKLLKRKKKNEVGEILRKNFDAAMDLAYLRSLVEPGEAVGVVAGQSIGEPSTQMTLNTFHLAGHSAKNVTLGIPRLREIVMTASQNISTPAMTLYPHPELSREDVERFAKSISRLPLTSVLDKVTVTEEIGNGMTSSEAKTYKIRLDFYPSEEYTQEYAIKIKDVVDSLEKKFIPRLQKTIRADLKKKGQLKSLATANSAAVPVIGQSAGAIRQQEIPEKEGNEGGEEDEASDDDENDGDAGIAKARGNREDSVEFDAPDEDEQRIAEQLRREDSPDEEEDETYGGSPKPASPEPEPSQDDEEEEMSDEQRRIYEELSADRKERVMKTNTDVADFKFDEQKGNWAEIVFEYQSSTKVLMLNLVEQAAEFATIQVIPGLNACSVSTENVKDPATGKDVETLVINTEGSNLLAMREFGHIIDTSRIFTNDVAANLRLYGVEACRSSIVREMHAVFSGHGISVDLRHLFLIADMMTRFGGYTPFNRYGMKASPSPFQKMSFETTVGFLKDAVLERDWEELKNPSARIVVGRLNNVGTGSFDVFAQTKPGSAAVP